MIKLTKRKAFNFMRSYYDVFNELNDKEKLQFIKALLDKQFQGINPTDLTGNAKFAWISQMHLLDESVKGYEYASGVKLTASEAPLPGGTEAPHPGGKPTPLPTREEKRREEKRKEKADKLVFPFDSEKFKSHWQLWKEYKKKEHAFNYKSDITEQAGLKKLGTLAGGNEQIALAIVEQSIANGWRGLFALVQESNSSMNKTGMTEEEFYKSFE